MATDDYCLIKSKIAFIWQIFFLLFLVTVPKIIILTVLQETVFCQYIIILGGGFAETWGKCVNFPCKLNIFMLATI